MKRFHVHVSVPDLAQSISFYNKLFGVAPSVHKDDYAKWMLDDPRVNFAISARGAATGVNHLGFQLESEAELAEQRQQIEDADLAAIDESDASCCYANSNKYWIQDPAGIAWETFQTMGEIPVFGQAAETQATSTPGSSVCCPPSAAQTESAGGCCG